MKSPLIRRRKSSGFTLIELMVVIAIIAALAAVAYPSYIGYLNNAKRTTCMAHLKELYNYGTLYSNDHTGILPCSGMTDDPRTKNIDESKGWWVALVPYVYPSEDQQPSKKTDPIYLPDTFRCPGDQRVNGVTERDPAMAENVSYASWTDNSANRRDPRSPIQTTRGQMLSGVPWLTDGIAQADRSIRTESDFETYVLPESEEERHTGYVCVVYADGSVKAVENATFKKVAPSLAENQ